MKPLMIWIAFCGGVLSFLSPCILPVAPGYLAIVSGISLDNLQSGEFSKRKVLIGTLSFILGFTIIFVTLGTGGSFLGQLLRANRNWLAGLSGLVVILLGLHQGGWLKVSFLYRERRLINKPASSGPWGAFLAGLAFAFGWTPCVGPILGSILALAGNQESMAKGFLLLVVYSIGLGVPFFALALAFEKVSPSLGRIKPYLKYFQWASGLLIILMGVLLLTGGLSTITVWLIRITGGWNLENLINR